MPAGDVVAVRDVTLSIEQGEHTAISGPSGCGKSTLLHMLGCVDTPSSGTLLFDGQDVATLNDRARSLLRLRQIGFVFQRFFLLPMLTAAENVELPQSEAGVAQGRAPAPHASSCSSTSGSAPRADHRPSQLSGGEMQRVAIARALANRPRLLLADEPTGELDQATGEQVASLLDRVNADGTALVIVTHDPDLAGRARRVLTMSDGRIERRGHAMIGRLAVRSLTAHPVRSAVLAAGFGVGVAVMAILLGVAQIVLEQSRAPALVGGGDVLIRLAEQVPGRLVLSGALQSDALRPRIRAAAPTHTATLFLLHDGRATRVQARGGIPSLERALGDEETSGIAGWRDSPDDVAWTQNTPGQGAALHRPVSSGARRAGVGRVVGGVAVLQRPARAGRAVLPDVPGRAGHQRRHGRGPPACGCSSIAAARWRRSAPASRSPTPRRCRRRTSRSARAPSGSRGCGIACTSIWPARADAACAAT